MSTVSYYTNSALLKTGIMDATPGKHTDNDPFDFNFKIKNLEGDLIDFNEYKGKVVFVNLWATWCGPCRVEMPSIQKLYDDVDHVKIMFVMLSLDSDDAHAKVVNYIAKTKFTFPVYQPHGYLAEQLQVPSIPTTFIIDKAGNIVSKKVGTTNFNTEKFKEYLEELTE
jgi:thiol-disulfide isomerase/thioredoxin